MFKKEGNFQTANTETYWRKRSELYPEANNWPNIYLHTKATAQIMIDAGCSFWPDLPKSQKLIDIRPESIGELLLRTRTRITFWSN